MVSQLMNIPLRKLPLAFRRHGLPGRLRHGRLVPAEQVLYREGMSHGKKHAPQQATLHAPWCAAVQRVERKRYSDGWNFAADAYPEQGVWGRAEGGGGVVMRFLG